MLAEAPVRVEVIRGWPGRFESAPLSLPAGSTAAQALRMAGWGDDPEITGLAVYGLRITPEYRLSDGDRVELLRPLTADPKDARRRRALRGRG